MPEAPAEEAPPDRWLRVLLEVFEDAIAGTGAGCG